MCLGKALVTGPADDRRWLMACLAIGPILVFTAVALNGTRVLYHWAAPGYLMRFPLLGAEVAAAMRDPADACPRMADRDRSVAGRRALGRDGHELSAVARHCRAGRKPVPDPLLGERRFANELGPELRGAPRPGRQAGIVRAATRWHEAGKIDYALGGRLPVLCLCRDARGYGVLMQAQDASRRNRVDIGRNLSPEHIRAVYAAYFDSIVPMPPVTITRAGTPALELSVYLGHALRAASERPSLFDPLSLRRTLSDRAGPQPPINRLMGHVRPCQGRDLTEVAARSG